ncbi:cupin domain-containing protein [Oceanibium sediminis]|uniref:cupin domain-containing protein n=1 Tax=Oceanibium sediminis TaxID=2026339 RepID=UPI0013008A05|nr:cupin domain-containing protein [Oceanibium sediminis]
MTRMTTTITAIAMACLTVGAATGSEEETVTMLLNQTLAGMNGKEVNMVQVDVPAGFETERHLHPGHMFMYVLDGAVEIEVEGLPTVQLAAGEAVYEIPGIPMVGRNLSTTEGATLLIFALGDVGAPLELPAPE